MSTRNLGLGSVKTFDRYGNETLESQNSTSVFLVSHLVGDIREEARKEVERVVLEVDGIYGDWIIKRNVEDKGYLPRNTDVLNRQQSYGQSKEGNINGYKIGSFELLAPICYGGIYKSFISGNLLLELWQIESDSSINWKLGLGLELKEGSKITLSQLGEALTNFIAGFIKTLEIDIEELETLEYTDEFRAKWILPKLPESFDENEREKLLFSISQSVKGNKIYFTDLTPIHPNFLHELLLYLDNRFGEK